MKTILFLLVFFSFVYAFDSVAIVKNVKGEVYAKRADKLVRLKAGSELTQKDVIITKENSAVGIVFKDGSLLSLGENSVLSIRRYIFKPSSNDFDIDLKLKKGTSAFESGKIGKLSPKSVKFRVPEGVIGIRGTKFFVEAK